ncbi:MAG: FtsX-like permease family protein [Bryobacterales bacterium]|nr:FtsX-like permease family protein [Bryobacterales bacterium]
MSDSVLRVFGMRLTSGRDFSAAESRADAPVVLINQPMAEALWPQSSALGRRIRIWSKGKPGRWQEVIGVVAEKAIAGESSVSHSTFHPVGSATNGWLQARTRGERGKAALAVRRVIRELDPRIAANVTSLRVIVDFMRWGPRLVAIGSFIVAISSLLMAAIGLYGVTAYIAARRTKEIGIRMALGAHPGHILRIMTRRGGRLVATGLVVGSMLAFAAERVLAAGMQLIPVSPPTTYLLVGAFLGAVAMLAILVPSFRAARIDPVAALRHDG